MVDVTTIGNLTIRQLTEELFENYTVSRKKEIGKIIPFHVSNDHVDMRIGYAIFINGERDIRTLEVHKDFSTFGRLTHGLRLAIQPIPNRPRQLYAELRQALPKDSFDKHETLHPITSDIDLDAGAGLPVFELLRRTGAEVGTKQNLLGETNQRAAYLCISFPKDNLWPPVAAYVATRILPMARGYSGNIFHTK